MNSKCSVAMMSHIHLASRSEPFRLASKLNAGSRLPPICAYFSTSENSDSTGDCNKKTDKSDGLMDTVDKMRQRLGDSSPKEKNPLSQWDELWKDGLTPWDLGKPAPVLVVELEQQRQRVPEMEYLDRKTSICTLVPGCGAGHDLITLSRHQDWLVSQKDTITDSVVVGLDISPTSLERAANVVEQRKSEDEHPLHNSRESTRIELKCGDFFADICSWTTVHIDSPLDVDHKMEERSQASHFDLIFDYTFFCALPPSLRSAWGERISNLLCPQSGKLLTVIFPILPEEEDTKKGPPYPVNVQDYRDVLEPHGVIMESDPYESPYTVRSRAGKELVCWWKVDNS